MVGSQIKPGVTLGGGFDMSGENEIRVLLSPLAERVTPKIARESVRRVFGMDSR